MKKRTFCNISCEILTVSDDWDNRVFIGYPFGDVEHKEAPQNILDPKSLSKNQTILDVVENWKCLLDSGCYGSFEDIACHVSVSARRVRQIL